MLMKQPLIIFLLLSSIFAMSQTVITGNVKNTDGEPVVANVMVQESNSKTISGYSMSENNGDYTITYKGTGDSITLTVSGLLIGKHTKTVANKSGKVDFEISQGKIELKEVNVIAPNIRQTGDTLNYSVSAYRDQNDRVIGDVLKKMPGIEVKSSGAISYQGEPINKFYIENMDLLQGRYGIATKNIAAKDILSVQVYENHQPIKALRKRVFSNKAAINLKLRDEAKGTLSVTGLAGLGYKPFLWNGELVAMYFGRTRQNMSSYKGNNIGENVTSEFMSHYSYERVYITGSPGLNIQEPGSPPVPQKRYLDNRSNAVTVNQLFKVNEDTELTANILYYNDKIEKEGYSLTEQFLSGDNVLTVEEEISSVKKINNADIAIRMNTNASEYYINNAFNIKGSWNDNTGTGITRSNSGNLDKTIRQHLEDPSFSLDNTITALRTKNNNILNIFFSAVYSHKPLMLTVTPADYMGDGEYSSLSQGLTSNDFASLFRVSYSRKISDFDLSYNVWTRVDVKNMTSALNGEDLSGNFIAAADTLRNNLWYNTYQVGLNQTYKYTKNSFRTELSLPLTYYMLTVDDRIPSTFNRHTKFIVNPSFSMRYTLFAGLDANMSANYRRSFGDMNSSYSGYIMHSYRSLLRNTLNDLYETRSGGANLGFTYRDPFKSLFFSTGASHNRSWRNLLYGYNYQGIMSIKNTLDQPTNSENTGIRFEMSKGLGFWSSTLRLFGGYNQGSSEALIQDAIYDMKSQSYNAGSSFNLNPISKAGASYSFQWNRSRNYVPANTGRFPSITGTSQTAQINIYPSKAVTINLKSEYQYNSAASQRYTNFADATVKIKHKRLDFELEWNNIFNSKQYISASYSDISTYYYRYDLRPSNVVAKIRFKLK